MEQALADYAVLLTQLKQEYKINKVVAFGGRWAYLPLLNPVQSILKISALNLGVSSSLLYKYNCLILSYALPAVLCIWYAVVLLYLVPIAHYTLYLDHLDASQVVL